MQKIILWSRFVGYVGVSVSSLIFPILVYQITQSAQLAGIIMLIEWVPKILVYLFGGIIINKITPVRSYQAIDLLRAITFILFALAIYFQSITFLLIAAPIAQCCNAISNIMFESLVSFWWKDDEKIKAHSKLLRLDIFAGILIVPIVTFLNMYWVMVFGFTVFLINFLISYIIKYEYIKPLEIKKITPKFKESIRFLKKTPELLSISLIGLANGIPIALISAQLPFFINLFNSNLAESASFISTYKAVVSILSIIFLFLLAKIKIQKTSLDFSRLLFVISVFGVTISNNLFVFLFFFILASFAYYGLMIHTKNIRQNLISSEKRIELTGILIAIDSFAYVIASLFLILFSNYFMLSIGISLFVSIVMTINHFKYERGINY